MAKYNYNKFTIVYGSWSPETQTNGSTAFSGSEIAGYGSEPSWNGQNYSGTNWGFYGVGTSLWMITNSDTYASKTYYSATNVTNGLGRVYNYYEYTRTRSMGSGNLIQANISAEDGTYPNNGKHTDGFWYVKVGLTNTAPTLLLNTTNNRTLYENDTLTIDGSTTDINSGNVVNVKYQLNNGTVRAIITQISAGVAVPFSKTIQFKAGKLMDGTTELTGNLNEGTNHTLKVWAEDDQGGRSVDVTRTFQVVANRPPVLTIEPFTTVTGQINTDTITIRGNVSDLENNAVTVKYKIKTGLFVDAYSGNGGPFSFGIKLDQLTVGSNDIMIQASDSYGAVSTKIIRVIKTENSTALKNSTVRYKLTPPNSNANGIILWIQREVGDLIVNAEVSMTAAGAAENFMPMTKTLTAFVADGLEEDEYTFDAGAPKENITLKVTYVRAETSSNKSIKLISGVLS